MRRSGRSETIHADSRECHQGVGVGVGFVDPGSVSLKNTPMEHSALRGIRFPAGIGLEAAFLLDRLSLNSTPVAFPLWKSKSDVRFCLGVFYPASQGSGLSGWSNWQKYRAKAIAKHSRKGFPKEKKRGKKKCAKEKGDFPEPLHRHATLLASSRLGPTPPPQDHRRLQSLRTYNQLASRPA